MTGLLAGLAGARVVAGAGVIAAGTRRAGPAAPRPAKRRTTALRPGSVRSGWARWRWSVAAGAAALAWVVSGWPVAALITAAAVVGMPVLLGTAKVSAGRIDRVEAIEEWTRRLSDILLAGAGLEQAITASLRTCPPPIRAEISALVARLAARWPTEQALRAFADDLDDAAADLVAAALLLASRRRGPGLARVLVAVAGSVAEDVGVRRKVEAERAKPRATARAVTLITVAVVAVGAFNGTYLAPYADPLGQVVLAVVAAGFIGCLVWMRALTVPAAEPRFLTGPDDVKGVGG